MKSKRFFHRAQAVLDSVTGVDSLLIEKPIDLFYLTGLTLSVGSLYLSKNEARLFVDGRYLAFAHKHCPYPCFPLSLHELQVCLRGASKVGFDAGWTSYGRWQELKKAARGKLCPLHNPVSYVRALKTAQELAIMRQSAKLAWEGYRFLTKLLKRGVTERALALKLEMFCLEHGADKLAFEPIIAFGKNSAFPHHRTSTTALKRGDIVLIDLGVVIDRYHSDMTRTLFYGPPNPKLVELERVVREAHQAALAVCRPGVKIGLLDKVATEVVRKAGMEPYLAHSLGHGVGLEIHEFPRIKDGGTDGDVPLKAGMVITIEPGLYWPGVGGVRYEDTIVITKTGYENWY